MTFCGNDKNYNRIQTHRLPHPHYTVPICISACVSVFCYNFCRYRKTSLPLPQYYRIIFTVPMVCGCHGITAFAFNALFSTVRVVFFFCSIHEATAEFREVPPRVREIVLDSIQPQTLMSDAALTAMSYQSVFSTAPFLLFTGSLFGGNICSVNFCHYLA